VFVTGGDPVIDGFAAGLSRPGGNTTGVSFLTSAVVTKRLELLRQLVPKAAAIGVLVNLNTPQAERERRDVEAAAHAIGQELIVVEADSDRDIETVRPAWGWCAVRRYWRVFALPSGTACCASGPT
jgi:ABC-type uncharacterized transport system substrate-binding protein